MRRAGRSWNRLLPLAAGAVLLSLPIACGARVGGGPAGGHGEVAEVAEMGEMAEAMVRAHNEARARDGVGPVRWSEELARYAREWADELRGRGCAMEHRPARGPFAQRYGENLFWASARRWSDGRTELQGVTPARVVAEWVSEKGDYDYESGRCRRVCGHYTQVVWAATDRVGCARAVCPDDSQVWVCNYDPPGNVVGRKPY